MTSSRDRISVSLVFLWVLALTVAAVGCDSDDACIEGRSVECSCADGSSGTQTCRSDGAWSDCRCDAGDADVASDSRDGTGSPDSARAEDSSPVPDSLDGGPDGVSDAEPRDGEADDTDGANGPEYGGLFSARATSRFEHEVSPPSCDESRDSVKIIDEDSDWDVINSDQYHTFCVRPGNYRSAANRIELTASGTKGDRRYILYDGPTDAHPVDRDDSERAVVDGLHFEGDASYWTVTGLTIDTRDDERARNAVLTVFDGSQHNVLDRLLASGPEGEFVNRVIAKIRGDHTTIQNSVFRNTRNPDSDRNCIGVSDDRVEGTRIVSNQLYDCTDSVQLVISSGSGLRYYPKTLIAHNDMFHSEAFRTDGNGNFDPNGDWTCGENAIDIKGTAESEDDRIRVIGNRMWGYSDTDENCGGSGSGPFSKAIVLHQAGDAATGPKYVEIRNNVIFDTAAGIAFSQVQHVTVANNLFHSYGYRDGNGNKGYGLMAFLVRDATFSGNVFTRGRFWMKAYNDSSVVLKDNVAVDAGESGTSSGDPTVQTSGNAYYGESTPWSDAPAIERDSAAAANNATFCVTLKAYTKPTERCFEDAATTPDSPHGSTVGFTPPSR